MKRYYPYLQDSYFRTTLDQEREKRTVLTDIQEFVNQRQYVRMTLLDWDENPIKDIEGIINSGSISKNGDSSVRRSASLSCAVDARSYDIRDADADFAINKKIFIELGVLNETENYPDWPIFWFPQGVFFISDFAINSSSSSTTNINISLKDKMMGLNGDVGGTLPAMVNFDVMDTQLPNGEYVTQKVLIYNIIKELVNHYGNEDLNNIVIEDVPLRIKRVMMWNGTTPLYATLGNDNVLSGDGLQYTFSLTQPDGDYITYNHGDDIGYIYDDFVIIDELVGNAGETVVSILDRIKEILGNYEYFYDEFGIFHFREIKNYLNTTQGKKVLEDMAEKEYLVEINNERSIFTFTDESLLTSITVTPQYGNIKNDYIVQGLHQMTDSDISYPIRYHLAIDKKPRPIGKDNRATISQLPDNTDKIAAGQLNLDNLNDRLKVLNREYQLYQTRIDALKRTIEQRKVELNEANSQLMFILLNISEQEYSESIANNPEAYWTQIWGDTSLSLKNFIIQRDIQNLLSIWADYKRVVNLVTPTTIAQEMKEIKANLHEKQTVTSQKYFDSLDKQYTKKEAEEVLIAQCEQDIATYQASMESYENEIENLKNQISNADAALEALKNNTSMETVSNPNLNRYYYATYNQEMILYKEKDTDEVKASFVTNETLPDVGNFNKIYKQDNTYYYWTGEVFKEVDLVEKYTANEYYAYDWRTKLYLDGVMASFNADTDKGYYYEELAAFWPQVYNLQKQCFYGEEDTSDNKMITLTKGYYYLDFLDSIGTSFGEWSVDNIGRRSNVVVEDKINCLFQPEIPNVILINVEHIDLPKETWALETEKTPRELVQEAIENNMPYTQVEGEIYSNLITGGYKNAAFDQIKYELFLHTRYQKTVSLTAIPVFYLEPNSRVTISDSTTNTYGDFVTQNVSITLGPGANMSVACHETLERF